MNPFVYAIREPVAAFADFAVLCAFLTALVLVVWALSGNIIAIYDEWDRGGWSVLPPVEWVFRVAAVPAAVAVASWLLSAMFALFA